MGSFRVLIVVHRSDGVQSMINGGVVCLRQSSQIILVSKQRLHLLLSHCVHSSKFVWFLHQTASVIQVRIVSDQRLTSFQHKLAHFLNTLLSETRHIYLIIFCDFCRLGNLDLHRESSVRYCLFRSLFHFNNVRVYRRISIIFSTSALFRSLLLFFFILRTFELLTGSDSSQLHL